MLTNLLKRKKKHKHKRKQTQKRQSFSIDWKNVYLFTRDLWRPRWKRFALAFFLTFMALLMDALLPVYIGSIIDSVTNDEQARLIGNLAVFTGLLFGFTIFRALSFWTWNRGAVECLAEIVTRLLRKVQRFSSDWHVNSFAGATVRKITRGMWSFDRFADTIFMGLFPTVSMTFVMTAVLLVQIPPVGLFTLVMVIAFSTYSIITSNVILAPMFQRSVLRDTEIGARLADVVTGNPTVKAFGAEEREDNAFERFVLRWKLRSLPAWQTTETLVTIGSALRNLMLMGMIGIAVYMVQTGSATPGDIAMVLTSYFMISGYLREIGRQIHDIQSSASEMEDAIEFWFREDELRDAPNAVPFVRKSANGAQISFDKVGFTYDGQNRSLFEDLSLEIAPGEKIALVGHSGSGKSTFVKLLQRLYDINHGEIRVDGQNIASLTQTSLRRAMALVPQDPILFHRSLAENIAYGRPDAPRSAIIDAAKKAYAHEFISNLPLGYDTLVGERGVKLSGGERQRVAIARAIVADTPILIMDEATSSLDSVSEHYIQLALEALMRGRTSITVAHRLSTVKNADRILVFSGGKIIEQGTHNQLIRRKTSHYRELYEMQALALVET